MNSEERIKKLEATLDWVLSGNITVNNYGDNLTAADHGCGCCSDVIEIPDELKQELNDSFVRQNQARKEV